MRKKLNIFIAGMLISAIGMVSSGAALFSITGETVNIVSSGSVAGRIVEEYETAENVYPGATVDKVVNIENTGEMDILVRVKVEKAWGERAQDGSLIVDNSLNSDYIIIDCNTEKWVYRDGYYYYKGVLEKGEITAEPLFSEFTIDENAGNEYKNKSADIKVRLECVQADGGGAAAWGTTLEQLGIEYTPGKTVSTAKIGFDGEKFSFENKEMKEDLFYDFKNLVPGESRTQTVTISNTSGESSEIKLKANFAEQSAENAQLIEAMLSQHLTVTITDGGGNVIYTGPIYGNLVGDNEQTMKNYISLGEFENGQTKTLTVNLSVSTEMDNDYQSLEGKVTWELLAGIESTTTTTEPSATTTTTPSATTTTTPSATTTTKPSATTTTTPSATTTTKPSAATTTKPSATTTTKPTTTKPTTTTTPSVTTTTVPTTTAVTATTAVSGYATPSDAENDSNNTPSNSDSNGSNRPGNRPGSNSGNSSGSSSGSTPTKGSSSGTGLDLPTTGGKISFAAFIVSFLSFISFLCAYMVGRRKQSLENAE